MPFQLLPRAGGIALIVLLGIFFVLFPDNSVPDQWAHFFSDHFNYAFQSLAHLLIFYCAWRLRSWRPVLLDIGVAAAVTGVVQLAKRYLIADIAVRPSGGYEGFPSGHVSATFSLAFVLSLYYPRLWLVWYTAAALVSWSRVQANAHTELQVVGGMVFGTLAAYGFASAIWRDSGTGSSVSSSSK